MKGNCFSTLHSLGSQSCPPLLGKTNEEPSRICSPVQVEFLEQVVYMVFDRRDLDSKTAGYLFIREILPDEPNYF